MTTQAIEYLKRTVQELQPSSTAMFPDWLLERLAKCPFWINDSQEHYQEYEDTDGYCCFNDILGRPLKYQEPNKLYPFQTDIIIPAYEKYDAIWILKATGLGVTELTLRWLMYKAITGNHNKYYKSIMPVIVGPNVDLAERLIKRAKDMWFNKLGITFDNDSKKRLTRPVNDVTIEAFPSFKTKSFRSLENVSISFIDEGDYFEKSEQKEVLVAAERYRGKSGAKIIVVSTPGAPGGLMQTIDQDPNSIYHKLKLDWKYGENTIYETEDLEKAKLSNGWQREYCLQYLGNIGTIYNPRDIDHITLLSYDTSDDTCTSPYFTKWLAIDPGWGGSNCFGISIVQWKDSALEVVYEAELQAPLMEDVRKLIHQLIQKYHICRCYIDQSSAVLIRQLCRDYGETIRYDLIDEETREQLLLGTQCRQPLINAVNFRTWHKKLAERLHYVVSTHQLRVDPIKFPKTVIALRTATNKPGDIFDVDKQQTSHSDVFDALRMNMLCLRGGN